MVTFLFIVLAIPVLCLGIWLGMLAIIALIHVMEAIRIHVFGGEA